MTTTKHFGYYVFGKDMNTVDLNTLQKNGVTDIFLNYYAFTTHGESKVKTWIQQAAKHKINVHIWMQCFYDGEWHNPKTTNHTNKLKEAQKYANTTGVTGVHLDYLRYPGNAYKTEGGAEAITEFVKKVRKQNPKTFLSCAIMPEDSGKYYYGQDHEALGKIVDAILPMQYKGNYQAGTEWLTNTTKKLTQKATIYSALQTYNSDNDPTTLSSKELLQDCKTCLNNGAKGVILFRYGLSPNINFNNLTSKTTKVENMTKYKEIVQISTNIKNYVEKNHKFPTTVTVGKNKYTYGQCAYLLSTSITAIGKDITSKSVKNAEKASGVSINEKVYASDYKDQAKRVSQYIKQHGACPNYVTTVKSKKQVRPRDFIYAFARIIVFYENNKKTWPNYCTYKSGAYTTSTTKTTTKSKYGHATKSGCDNRGQNNGYYCGCHSLQEVFRNLTGKVVPQSTIASWAGTTSSGTDHDGLNTAVATFNKKYGFKLTVEWKNFSDLGWNGVKKIINSSNQDAVFHSYYRLKWGHYEVINSLSDSNIKVQNSLGDYCSNGCYCGYVEDRTPNTFREYMNGISQKSVMIITRK